MARADIPNGVLTIIASFSNGLEILRKLRRSDKKRPRRSKASQQTDEDALRLSRSLRHGPEEIGREYQAGSMRCDSERFAAGDATAHNSLAEILLKLNTGLVGIIASFTAHGTAGPDLDYRSLTALSERSRVQTVGVLRQLCQRLMLAFVPANLPHARSDKVKTRKPSHRGQPKRNKKRHPTLARVLIENSSVPSQIAMVRSSDARKQRITAQSSPTCGPSRLDTGRRMPALPKIEAPSPPPPYSSSNLALEGIAPSGKSPRHQCSCNSIQKSRSTSKSDFSMTASVKEATHDERANKLVSTPASNSIPVGPKPQKMRPNTFYSIASARTGSTKLGEIPMHKWAEPWDYKAAEEANKEALASGWPVSGNAGTGKQRKGVWKRWFGRKPELA